MVRHQYQNNSNSSTSITRTNYVGGHQGATASPPPPMLQPLGGGGVRQAPPPQTGLSANLSELDLLLQDLSSAQFMDEVDRRNAGK